MKVPAINKGFTLIELVITITLMIILAGSAIVNVTSFNQNQGTTDDIKAVQSEIRSAYSKATGHFYPAGCTNLRGYTVSVTTGSKDVTVTANCDADVPSNKIGVLKSSNFVGNYTLTISTPDGATSPSPTDIIIKSDSNPSVTKTLRVSSYGVFEIL